MTPRRGCIYRNEADVAAAVTTGALSEHDATAIRQFMAFLAQAPPPPPRPPKAERETT